MQCSVTWIDLENSLISEIRKKKKTNNRKSHSYEEYNKLRQSIIKSPVVTNFDFLRYDQMKYDLTMPKKMERMKWSWVPFSGCGYSSIASLK